MSLSPQLLKQVSIRKLAEYKFHLSRCSWLCSLLVNVKEGIIPHS